MEENKKIVGSEVNIDALFDDVRNIIHQGIEQSVRTVHSVVCMTYWKIGRRIVEEEQQGKARADYGTYLLRNLAKALEPDYGSGFSYRQLALCRQFYLTYPIVHTLYSQLN